MHWLSVSRRRMRPALVVAVLALVAALVPVVPVAAAPVTATVVPVGATIYVDNSVDGPGTGTAEDPYALLGDALAIAEAGDTIMVAEGVYGPDSGEMLPFIVPSDVTIIGEYDDEDGWLTQLTGWGVAPLGAAEVPEAPIMILGDEPILELGGLTDVPVVGGASGVALQGLAFAGNSTYGMGAGIVAYESQFAVDNCLFENLVAERGSAIFVVDSDVDVSRSVFAYNGGVVSDRAATTDELPFGIDREALRLDKIPAVSDVAAQIEEGAYYGGAVLSAFSDLSVSDTVFVANSAMVAGGAILTDSGTCTTDRSLFLGNYASGKLIGSVAVEDAEEDDYVSALIDNGIYVEPFGGGAVCNLTGAYAADSSFYIFNEADPGAAIVTFLGSTELDRCGIGMNWGAAVVAFGEEVIFDDAGALDYEIDAQQLPVPLETWSGLDIDRSEFYDNDGFFTVYSSSSPTRITNSVFAGNWAMVVARVESARELDGVEVLPEPQVFEASIEGCTFSRNLADYAMVHGPKDNYLPLINSVIWDNGGNELDATWDASNVHAFNVDHEGELDAGIEQDCFSEDPLFFDGEEFDFRLTPDSPCIDAGTTEPAVSEPAAAEALLSWDLRPWDVRNLGRPVDGDGDGEALYDVGAHEYLGSTRAGGADRFETSVLVSQQHFGQADTVVIATGRIFADGLSGSGLAGIHSAPILLTEPNVLPVVVSDEIVRLGARKAFILGGTDAVGPAVEAALVGLGLEIERIGGVDRYETAALVAAHIAETAEYSAIFSEPTRVAFIARGDLFADALAVSPVAYANHAPVLLVRPGELPDHTVDILLEMGINEAVVLGGQVAVDTTVADEVAALVSETERIDGADRYETAANIAEWAWENELASFEFPGVATGDDFADALSGGAGIGGLRGVLLLTPAETVHPACEAAITAHAGEITGLITFGGPNAVSNAVYNQLIALLAP